MTSHMAPRKAFAAFAAIFFAITLVGAALALTTDPQRPVAGLINYVLPGTELLGGPTAPVALSYAYLDLPISVQMETQGIYASYGGAVRLGINNTDSSYDLWVTGARVRWNNAIMEKDVQVSVGGNSEKSLGIVWLAGPLSSGQQSYKISLRILVNSTGWHRLGTMGNEWTEFQQGQIDVKPLGTPSQYRNYTDYYLYYDKANELVKDEPASVDAELAAATQGLGSDYTYEKLCAVFDYVSKDIKYVREPAGSDRWQSPGDTLTLKTGDCEDYALLIIDMVLRMGGAARLYLIEDHAFAAVWVGNDTSVAEGAARTYYGTAVKMTYMRSSEGYWLVADPLGSLYAGGLPVGSGPVASSGAWDFTGTDIVHAVDMTRKPGAVQPWEQDKLMAGLQLASDITLIIAILLLVPKKQEILCGACGKPCVGTVVVCPSCKTVYHPGCNPEALCKKCGAPMPAPPNAR